ncbi:hypothetical protein FQR65_LT20601 [Abscondita terminalis]|nr:hypothetical protein FQR65_LT20601 [Abscondita terminalis]
MVKTYGDVPFVSTATGKAQDSADGNQMETKNQQKAGEVDITAKTAGFIGWRYDAVITAKPNQEQAGENIGNYIAITTGTLAVSGNYDIIYTDAKSKVYGTVDPALTYTVTGLSNGDTDAVITGNLTRTAGENIGNYAITQGTLAVSGNYDIVYTGADFNITKAMLNIREADAKFKSNGAADPCFDLYRYRIWQMEIPSRNYRNLTRTAGENIRNLCYQPGEHWQAKRKLATSHIQGRFQHQQRTKNAEY